MYAEPYDDHEHEEEIERERDRPEGDTEVECRRGVQEESFRSREHVEERDTHPFLTDVSRERWYRFFF